MLFCKSFLCLLFSQKDCHGSWIHGLSLSVCLYVHVGVAADYLNYHRHQLRSISHAFICLLSAVLCCQIIVWCPCCCVLLSDLSTRLPGFEFCSWVFLDYYCGLFLLEISVTCAWQLVGFSTHLHLRYWLVFLSTSLCHPVAVVFTPHLKLFSLVVNKRFILAIASLAYFHVTERSDQTWMQRVWPK